MSEQDIMHRVMLALSRAGARVFRNNVAQAVVGGVQWIHQKQTVVVNRGDCVVRCARVLHAGLCDGSSDLIGWTPVQITPEMVGRTVAVFTAPEIKAEKGRKRAGQVNFCDQVTAAGGIAGFVRSPEEAVALLAEFRG